MKPTEPAHIQFKMPQRIITVFVAMMILCLVLSPFTSTGQCRADNTTRDTDSKTPEEIEYDVKAAFIYNFMKFIEWPADKKAEQDQKQNKPAPMTIGILGNNPFKESFKPLLGKTIQNRTIQLVQIQSYQAFYYRCTDKRNALNNYRDKFGPTIQQCDILFICKSENDVFKVILPLTHDHAVLTVSDITEFAKQGGMIGFVTENKKIRFEINLKSVTREQIKIRSQLLELARNIYKNDP